MEYRVKAVFLFNFAVFVDWPASHASLDTPFVIGVLGDDPFGTALDEVIAQEKIGQRPLVLRRFREGDARERCDILYISRSETQRLRTILDQVRGQPILTVADIPDFAEIGGMIEFSTEGGRVRLTINTHAIESSRLAVNAKLMKLARVIPSRDPE